MREKILNTKIPSLLGLVLILVGLAITTLLVKTGSTLTGQASPTFTPKNITVTNITDSSFTVSYVTDDKVIGTLAYGSDQDVSQTALDDRDQLSGNVSEYKIHNMTLNNLNPETEYFFEIISKGEKFLDNSNLFKAKTGSVIDSPPGDTTPISGKVLLPEGNPPSEGIAYFQISGAQNFSSLLKSDGTYLIPLNSLRTSDLSSYFDFSSVVDIKILTEGDGFSSNVTISSKQSTPVPTITLSNNYDFRTSESPIASVSADFPTFDSIPEAAPVASGSPTITSPKNNASVSDQQPEFSGTGVPGETVEITIQSDPIMASVKSNSSGKWTYRPTTPLAPGEHTITISTINASGILQKITKNFTVYASGEQVSESATPSASLTPSPSISPSPVASASPSSNPETSPSASVSSSPLPPTGSNSTVGFSILGIGITILGALLFLASRGAIH